MKTLLLFLLMAGCLSAATITARDGTVYKNAEVMKVETDGLRISYEAGVAKLTYEELPDALREKYKLDPAKVSAYRKAAAAASKAAEEKAQALERARAVAEQARQEALQKARVAKAAQAKLAKEAATRENMSPEEKRALAEDQEREADLRRQKERDAENARQEKTGMLVFGATFLMWFILWGIFNGLIGVFVGSFRNRRRAAFWWGFWLGFIGWIIVLIGPDRRRRCGRCRSVVEEEARMCPACHSELVNV